MKLFGNILRMELIGETGNYDPSAQHATVSFMFMSPYINFKYICISNKTSQCFINLDLITSEIPRRT